MSVLGVGSLEVFLAIFASVVVFGPEGTARGTLKVCRAVLGLLKGQS